MALLMSSSFVLQLPNSQNQKPLYLSSFPHCFLLCLCCAHRRPPPKQEDGEKNHCFFRCLFVCFHAHTHTYFYSTVLDGTTNHKASNELSNTIILIFRPRSVEAVGFCCCWSEGWTMYHRPMNVDLDYVNHRMLSPSIHRVSSSVCQNLAGSRKQHVSPMNRLVCFQNFVPVARSLKRPPPLGDAAWQKNFIFFRESSSHLILVRCL